MKTRSTLLYILTTLLSVFSIQTSYAQATQDALYIFRNDGQFNAFFYGDIDHIEYSKIDTLGVEQDDYVVQEVYALDSLWRIPLNAIDSVAFVTPETKVKADVFCPDKSIANYIVASDSLYWIRLAKNTPVSLIPKKGDKLLIEQPSTFIPEGFGGLVTAVDESGEGYTITTESLQLADVYDRLVMKGAAVTADQSSVKRRGLTDGTEGHFDTVFDFGIIEQTLNIAGSQSLIEGLAGNASLSIDGDGTIKYRITPKATVRGFLFYDYEYGVNTSMYAKVTCDVSTDANVSGALTAHLDIPFKLATNKKSIVKVFGKEDADGKHPCVFDFSAGAFIEATGGVNAKMKWGGSMVMGGNVTYTQELRQPLQEPNSKVIISGTASKPDFSLDLSSFALTLGVYAKGEIKFNNSFLKEDKFQMGVRGDVAATIAVNIGKEVLDISDDLWQTGEDRVYHAFNSDNLAFLDIFADVQAYAKLMKSTFGPWKKPASLLTLSCAGVPQYHNFEYKIDEKAPSIVKLTSLIGREVLTPTKVGYSVFQEYDKEEISSSWYGKTYQKEEFNVYSHEFDDLDPGIGYVAMPKIHFLDYSILVSDIQPAYFNLGNPMIDVEKNIEVPAEMGEKDVPLLTNIGNMEFKSDSEWLDYEWNRKEGKLTLSWYAMPEDITEREAMVHVTGRTIDGTKILLEDDIKVTQCKPYLFVEPPTMEFEAKGGTQKATITKTNLVGIRISTIEKYIEASLDGQTITVTMPENKEIDPRGGSVYFEGKTPGGQYYKTYLSVTQKASEEYPEDTTTTSTIKKVFCGKWRKLDDNNNALSTMIINEDLTYELKTVCIEDYSVGFNYYKKGQIIGNRQFGKFNFPDPDDWTELPKEYMQKTKYLQEYDKGYFVSYKQTERKIADKTYGKWLSDDNSTTMLGYFEISSDFKYAIEDNRYLWVKMDENDPYYPEPYMLLEDPAYLHLSDSVAYEINLRTEPERMKYDRFRINEELKFLKDIQVTPDKKFLHIESIDNGTVYYSFDENTTIKKREGHFNVQGTWPDGSIGRAVFTVRQDGGRTHENLSKIRFSGRGKAINTIVKKYTDGSESTETDENSSLSISLTATSFAVSAVGSALKIEANDEQNAKNVTFTLSEGFKKSSKANDIVYLQDYTKIVWNGTDGAKGSMKASNVPCNNDSGDKMTFRGELSDGVTISDANYIKYWEADPEKVSDLWYTSESYEYVNDSGNRVEIEITWNIDKWQR